MTHSYSWYSLRILFCFPKISSDVPSLISDCSCSCVSMQRQCVTVGTWDIFIEENKCLCKILKGIMYIKEPIRSPAFMSFYSSNSGTKFLKIVLQTWKTRESISVYWGCHHWSFTHYQKSHAEQLRVPDNIWKSFVGKIIWKLD